MVTVGDIVRAVKQLNPKTYENAYNIGRWRISKEAVQMTPHGGTGLLKLLWLENPNHYGNKKYKPILRIRWICNPEMTDHSQSKVEFFIDTENRIRYTDYSQAPVQGVDRNAMNSVLEGLGIKKEFRIKEGKLLLLDR
jgi:hypothetical protein